MSRDVRRWLQEGVGCSKRSKSMNVGRCRKVGSVLCCVVGLGNVSRGLEMGGGD